MTIYQPYVYIIRWTNANKGYIGARFAKGCQPSDLFVSYHTSSKYVRQIISEFGLPDKIKIFTYTTKQITLLMEEKFQRRFRVLDSDYWLNRNINGKGFSVCRGNKHSEKTKSKISQSNKGRILSESTRNKMSESLKNRSKETRKKMSAPNTGDKNYRYDGSQYVFTNGIQTFVGTRREFSNKFNLKMSSVHGLVNGNINKHKGWVIQK